MSGPTLADDVCRFYDPSRTRRDPRELERLDFVRQTLRAVKMGDLFSFFNKTALKCREAAGESPPH